MQWLVWSIGFCSAVLVLVIESSLYRCYVQSTNELRLNETKLVRLSEHEHGHEHEHEHEHEHGHGHGQEIAWEGYCGEHPTLGYRLEDAISIDLKRS